jgi:hypothetical protein
MDFSDFGWGYAPPGMNQRPQMPQQLPPGMGFMPQMPQQQAPQAPQPLIPPPAPRGPYDDDINKLLRQQIAQLKQPQRGGGGVLGALMSYMSPGGARAAEYMQDNRSDNDARPNQLLQMMLLGNKMQAQSAAPPVKIGNQYYWQTPGGFVPAGVEPEKEETTTEKNAKFYRDNPWALEQQKDLKKSGATNVTVDNAGKIGKIPDNSIVVEDPNSPVGYRIEELPSSAAKKKAGGEALQSADQADSVLTAIQGIKDAQESATLPATGTLSRIPGLYSESAAGEVASRVEAIKSPQVLATLATLKKLSENGASGFGATQKNEIDLMTNELGSLDPTGNTKAFNETLGRVEGRYKRLKETIIRNFDNYPPEVQQQLSESGLLAKAPTSPNKRPSDWSKSEWNVLSDEEKNQVWKLRQ